MVAKGFLFCWALPSLQNQFLSNNALENNLLYTENSIFVWATFHLYQTCTCHTMPSENSLLGTDNSISFFFFADPCHLYKTCTCHATPSENSLLYTDDSIVCLCFFYRSLPSLQNLYLSHNAIGNISSLAFKGLLHLDELDLSFNNIKDVPKESFAETPHLTVSISCESLIDWLIDWNRVSIKKYGAIFAK